MENNDSTALKENEFMAYLKIGICICLLLESRTSDLLRCMHSKCTQLNDGKLCHFILCLSTAS